MEEGMLKACWKPIQFSLKFCRTNREGMGEGMLQAGWKTIQFSLILALALPAQSMAPIAGGPQPEPYQDAETRISEEALGAFCDNQRDICLQMCNLQSFNRAGCTLPCKNRVAGCLNTGCYSWTPADFRIAVRFGAQQCF
jgi:hypothetical protein